MWSNREEESVRSGLSSILHSCMSWGVLVSPLPALQSPAHWIYAHTHARGQGSSGEAGVQHPPAEPVPRWASWRRIRNILVAPRGQIGDLNLMGV